jgi:hypothetical protein
MKTALIIAAIIFFTGVSIKTNAQLPHAGIYVHALYATPLDGSSPKLYNGGVGAVGGVLVGGKTTRFSGSVGYSHFFADDSKNPLGAETYVPVKVGIRQYIPLTLHFLYVQGNAGVGFVSNANSNNTDSRFAFDFGAGVKFTAFEAALIWDNFHEKSPDGISSWVTVQAGINLGF